MTIWALLGLNLVATPVLSAVDASRYQMRMAPAPDTAVQAIATLPDRRTDVQAAMACGSELSFAAHYLKGSNNEDYAGEILGKLAWFQRGLPFNAVETAAQKPCRFSMVATAKDVCAVFEANCRSDDRATSDAAALAFLGHPAWSQLGSGFASDLRLRLIIFLPTACNDAKGRQMEIDAALGSAPNTVNLTFTISPDCLIGEVNAALMRIDRGTLQVGTGGGICHFFSKTEGDWDSTLKLLIRVAELDRDRPSLDAPARARLNDHVIDIDGGPAQESYPLWECGNEEKSVGDPKSRSDDRDGVDGFLDDIWDSGWDIFWFLLALLLFFLLLLWAAYALVGFFAALLTAAAVALAVASLLIWIPETENHLWMINSTKYLNNQYLMANGGTGYGSDQTALRAWILKEMQKIAQTDFIEYNSRPYARYSLISLTNLADFADDVDISTGARAILEYSIAKYAVTSSEGRRYAPFRRKREAMPFVDGVPRDGSALSGPPTNNGLFDLIQGSDHLHAIGLYYFGLSQNLLEFDGHPYAATLGGYPPQAIVYATSGYTPDEATYSLAIERGGAPLVHQRFHHYGYEEVSSGASFTITAGGVKTGMAKNVSVDPVDTWLFPDDAGAAVPTALMLAGAPHLQAGLKSEQTPRPEVPRPGATRRSTLDRFLRFEGVLPAADEKYATYDRNLCVWDGFACGVNFMIPDDLKAPCMTPGPKDGWFFIDSTSPACAAYAGAPSFSIALYYKKRLGLSKSGWGDFYSYGFLEIVDGAEMSFADFKARVLQRNPGTGAPMDVSGACSGAYVSARGMQGQRIEFSCERVTKVDGNEQPKPSDWPHAGAPPGSLGMAPIQSSGDGRIEITSTTAKRRVVLDLVRRDDPRFDTVTLP